MRYRSFAAGAVIGAVLCGCGPRTSPIPSARAILPAPAAQVPSSGPSASSIPLSSAASSTPTTPTPGPMVLVLSGAVNATLTNNAPATYDGERNSLGCGSALEDPAHPSFLATWITSVGGIRYLFYLNILNYHGPGMYSMGEAGTYLMIRNPSGAAATAYFYPAATTNNAGNFVDNKGEIIVNRDQRTGTLTAALATGADFQSSLASGALPPTSLTVAGRWSCP